MKTNIENNIHVCNDIYLFLDVNVKNIYLIKLDVIVHIYMQIWSISRMSCGSGILCHAWLK